MSKWGKVFVYDNYDRGKVRQYIDAEGQRMPLKEIPRGGILAWTGWDYKFPTALRVAREIRERFRIDVYVNRFSGTSRSSIYALVDEKRNPELARNIKEIAQIRMGGSDVLPPL